MDKTSRALRRHHFYRIKKARKNYWGAYRCLTDKELGMLVHTAAPCSCTMCGNPRKHFKLRTIAENIHILVMKEQLASLILR